MKKIMLSVLVFALAILMVSNSNAASKMSLSIGPDVLIPMGTFGDAYSTGFGGSVRGQYDISPMGSIGLTIGYYTWSGKEIEGSGFTIPDFKGLPVRVFGKYYFMPGTESARVYAIAELGLFFGSVGDQTHTIPGTNQTITIEGGSSSDFNYAPGLGFEFALGGGNTKLDVSVRYDGIATEGETSGSFAGRVGINFGLGN